MALNASNTKSGPGRKHKQGRDKDDRKKVKLQFGELLMTAWANLRAAAMRKRHPLRDEHGAFTHTGAQRRKWLAGISAQRGF